MPSQKTAFTVRWNADYAARLEQLQCLLGGRFSTPTKQHTLETAIDLALDALNPDPEEGEMQILSTSESADGAVFIRVRVGGGKPVWLSPDQVLLLSSTCYQKVAP